MNHIFKQSISIDGQVFPISQNGAPRVHAVPPKIEKHPHFKFYQKAGLIVSHAAPVPDEKPETPAERARRIHASKLAQGGEEDDDKTFDDEIADSDEAEGEDLEDESGDDDGSEDGEGESEGDESDSVEDDFDVEETDEEVEPKKKAMRPKAKKKKAKSRK